MNQTLGWRNYHFSDTHCGAEGGLQLWYDLNGQFNVCAAEVVPVVKKFIRKRKKLFRTIEIEDAIERFYVKISYLGQGGQVSSEIFEIREEEVPVAEEICAAIRKKVIEKAERDKLAFLP